MTDWLEDEKQRRERENLEHQKAKLEASALKVEANNFINSNQYIEIFINCLKEYIAIANSSGIHIVNEINKNSIQLSSVIKTVAVDKRLIREIEFSFHFVDKGYWIRIFEGSESFYDNRKYFNERKVLKRHSNGDYEWVFEYDQEGNAEWLKGGDTYNVFVKISDLDLALTKQIVTWISNRSDSISFSEINIKTDYIYKVNKHDTERSKAYEREHYFDRFGYEGGCNVMALGMFAGVLMGSIKGCNLNNISMNWGTFFGCMLVCTFLAYIIGLIFSYLDGSR